MKENLNIIYLICYEVYQVNDVFVVYCREQ